MRTLASKRNQHDRLQIGLSISSLGYALVVVLFFANAVCSQQVDQAIAPQDSIIESLQRSYPCLPNLIRVHERVYSGGIPNGEAGFQELEKLGIKTIVSVDATRPDIAIARQHGMRYVHLPLGYSGISYERTCELAKGVRDLPGPIYIHCHHGKHRSPAAVAVACVSIGLIEPQVSVSILEQAGTSTKYLGLFQAARDARRMDDRILDAMRVEFPEIATLPPMAEAMVEIDATFEQFTKIAKGNWSTSKDQPVDPAHEALILLEHFRELSRMDMPEVKRSPFQKLLVETEQRCLKMEEFMLEWKKSTYALPIPPRVIDAVKGIGDQCSSCHQIYRDLPKAESK